MRATRRKFIQSLGAAGISLASPLPFSAGNKNDDQKLFIGDNIAVASTVYGKVRGYVLRDIHYFLGIPYGADTSGTNRFMPPVKPDPWNDIYPAIWWGNSAPQRVENKYSNRYTAFRDHWNYDDISEDCLKINVLTPGYNDGKKRPVLFWIHGGGWLNGNCIEHDGYNGENIARLGDIVYCSINHRLGPIGFSDFSSIGGEKYAASGNVGAQDIVAALEWVHDNISNFGGDPENVTIIGQSGGGAKVCTITSLPSAKGLISKAVVLSGARLKLREKELKNKIGEYIIKEAGLKVSEIDKLQQLPWPEYYDLALRGAGKCLKDLGITYIRDRDCFQPAVDGNLIPGDPYSPDASPNAAELPMMICSATNEDSISWRDSSNLSVSIQDVKYKLLNNVDFPELSIEKAEVIVDAYAKANPDMKPDEIWSVLTTYRQRNVMLADVKSKQTPPVFMALFGWQPPLFDNRLRAFHTLDICFWFYNTDLMLSHTGGGSRPRTLSERMAGSLLQFMKTGDPNGGGLPEWPRYTAKDGELMFLNDVCEVQHDPDRETRKSLPDYKGY